MSKRKPDEDIALAGGRGVNGRASKAAKSQDPRMPKSSSENDSDSRAVEVKAGPSPPPKKANPAALAAAAAARISAQLAKTKKMTPPKATPSPTPAQVAKAAPRPPSPAPPPMPSLGEGEFMDEHDRFNKHIEINDLRNRYLLTKVATQESIAKETGTEVMTRGRYYPDKLLSTDRDPPLGLHIRSTTKTGMDAAAARIIDIIEQDLGSLVDERRFRRRDDSNVERDENGRRKWPEERVPIGLESRPGFNIRAQIVGPQGAYVKHIQQETKCRVQIKGRSSGFMEPLTGRESDEETFLWVAGPDAHEVQRAKALCEDLINSVREQMKTRNSSSTPHPPSHPSPGPIALGPNAGAPGLSAPGLTAPGLTAPGVTAPGVTAGYGMQNGYDLMGPQPSFASPPPGTFASPPPNAFPGANPAAPPGGPPYSFSPPPPGPASAPGYSSYGSGYAYPPPPGM